MNRQEFERGWGSGRPETPCGSGSKFENTRIQRKWIPEMVAKYNIRSIADMGAGDLNWSGRTEFGCEYTPYDMVPRHPSVVEFNLLTDEVPKVDCLLCLWVLNHLPEVEAEVATKNLMASKSKYLIYTYWPAMADFLDFGSEESVVIRPSIKAEMRILKCW